MNDCFIGRRPYIDIDDVSRCQPVIAVNLINLISPQLPVLVAYIQYNHRITRRKLNSALISTD
eukprot:scaffold1564_cov239-Chaetoceros_neogracile.AAC.5